MPDSPPPTFPVLLGFYLAVILIAALICLILDFSRDRECRQGVLSVWPIPWSDFIFFLWLIFVAFIGANLVAPQVAPLIAAPDQPDYWAWASSIMGLFVHALFILILIYTRVRSPVATRFPLNMGPEAWTRSLARGIFYYLAALPFILAGSLLWHGAFLLWKELGVEVYVQTQEIATLIARTENTGALILLVLLAVVIAPISEEWLFRANIYRFLKGRISPVFAMTVSSLLFALIHFNLKAFLPLFIVGILLCRAYEKSGRLMVPIVFHACFNANTTMILLVAPELEQGMGSFLPLHWLRLFL